MIGTMLYVIHQLIDWAGRRNGSGKQLLEKINEISTLELIESTLASIQDTDSVIVFSECSKPVSSQQPLFYNDNNNNYYCTNWESKRKGTRLQHRINLVLSVPFWSYKNPGGVPLHTYLPNSPFLFRPVLCRISTDLTLSRFYAKPKTC